MDDLDEPKEPDGFRIKGALPTSAAQGGSKEGEAEAEASTDVGVPDDDDDIMIVDDNDAPAGEDPDGLTG
eukprot:406299-Prorocentrum_minimum.AAC.1